VDQGSGELTVHPGAAAPPPALQIAPPAAPQQMMRRELAGVPKVEVVGLSKEKVEELFWDTITQVRADLAGVPRK
jgi:hypothetical protein